MESAAARWNGVGPLGSVRPWRLERELAAFNADNMITPSLAAEDLAGYLLGARSGVCVFGRAQPERALLKSELATAFALLDPQAVGRR